MMNDEVGSWEPIVVVKAPVHVRLGGEIYRGIYKADTETLLGIHKQREYVFGNDWAYYEMRAAFENIVDGVPKFVEMLFVPEDDVLIKSDVWNQIQYHRSAFLSTSAVRRSYSARAISAIEMLEHDSGKDSDRSGRLLIVQEALDHLRQGRQLLKEGVLVTQMEDQSFLWDSKDLSVKKMAKALHKELAKFRTCKSVLPDLPDTELVSQLLVEIRLSNVHADLQAQIQNSKDLIRTIYRQLGTSAYQYGAKALKDVDDEA